MAAPVVGAIDQDPSDALDEKELQFDQANRVLRENAITWHNYYDYGDPIGFKLDSARAWMDAKGLKVFAFTDKHDHGFARYMLPGAAHNEYWDDDEVFEHFISNVVTKNPPTPPDDAAPISFD